MSEDKKPLYLVAPMGDYDFSKEPLFSADLVITNTGRVCKNRAGKSGDIAKAEDIQRAKEVQPNR